MKTRLPTVLLWLTVLCLSAACAVLLASTSRTNANLAACMNMVTPLLQPGVVLPVMSGLDSRGTPLTVGFGTDPRPSLLLFYTPSCPYCVENWPAWDRLLRTVSAADVRVIAIDTSGQTDVTFLASHFMPSAVVFRHVDYVTAASYNLTAAPMTLVIDSDGALKAVWRGVLSTRDETAVTKLVMERHIPFVGLRGPDLR